MIAPVDKPIKTLIKKHTVDTTLGLVELIIPHASPALMKSMEEEIANIQSHNKYPVNFALRCDADTATISIQSQNVTNLAMNVTKIMTRRIQVFDGHSHGEVVHYASPDDTQSVLKTLKSHAQKTSPNAALAIDSLMARASEIALM